MQPIYAVTNLEDIDAEGYTTGWIEGPEETTIEDGAFSFQATPNEFIWDTLADEELKLRGYTRLGPWEGSSTIHAPIERI